MRALLSYGVALVIILGIAAWMATGYLVIGGQGPGEGEIALLNAGETGNLSPDQQSLMDELTARREAAARAREAAQAAEEEARTAAELANKADTSGLEREEELKKHAATLAEEAARARQELAQASAAAAAAEAEAAEARQIAEAFKPIAERGQLETASIGDKPRSVRIKTFTVQPMPMEVPLRGQTTANAVVSAVAETNGIVEEVAVDKGQQVARGDLLCRLDQGTRNAAVAQAKATVAQAEASLSEAQTSFESNRALREKGLAAANTGEAMQVAIRASEAALEAAKVGLDNAEAELERTFIRARVSGIVQSPVADAGTLLNTGQPCATIVELDPIVFVGSVPEARIGLARLGLPVHIETVAGDEADGTVTFISSVADTGTRTFRVEAEIPNPGNKLRDGLTASATVNLGTVPAHILPQSVLTLDNNGTLGIRAVEDDMVVFHPVTILKDTREGVWITGLPPQVDVITLGQEYVEAGQIVAAQKFEDEEEEEDVS